MFHFHIVRVINDKHFQLLKGANVAAFLNCCSLVDTVGVCKLEINSSNNYESVFIPVVH